MTIAITDTMMMVTGSGLSTPRLSGRNEFVSLKEVDHAVVILKPFTDDNKIKNYLGRFLCTEIAPDNCWKTYRPGRSGAGGRRKIQALDDFSTRIGKSIVARWAD